MSKQIVTSLNINVIHARVIKRCLYPVPLTHALSPACDSLCRYSYPWEKLCVENCVLYVSLKEKAIKFQLYSIFIKVFYL